MRPLTGLSSPQTAGGVLNTLRNNPEFYVRFDVTRAHRQIDHYKPPPELPWPLAVLRAGDRRSLMIAANGPAELRAKCGSGSAHQCCSLLNQRCEHAFDFAPASHHRCSELSRRQRMDPERWIGQG